MLDTQRIWNPEIKDPSEAESHVPERAVVVSVFEGIFPLTGSELDALCGQSNHDFVLGFFWGGGEGCEFALASFGLKLKYS